MTYQQPIELYLFQTESDSWRVTSADEAKEHLSQTYDPLAGLTRTELNQDQELRGGSLLVNLPKNHPIALLFVSSLPSTPLSLTLYRRDEAIGATGVIFIGRVVKAKFEDDCELECLPDTQVLRRRIPGPIYQRQCNRVLYAPGCDVDKEAFKVTGTISEISLNGFRVRAPEFAGQPAADWFDGGYLERGLQRTMILRQNGDQLDLITPMASLAVDDAVDAFPGCQRTIPHCRDKFDNLVRFFGFPFIPSKNPFDGLE